MTYAEAHQAALHWTAALDALGVTAGGTVATMLPPGIDYTALVLGIAWSPGVEVPINNAAKGALLQYILADSAAQVLFIHERLLAALDLVDLAATGVRAVIVFGEALPDRPESAVSWRTASDVLAATPTAADASGLQGPRDRAIAWIMYTSGTTGQSKGVMCTWRQVRESTACMAPLDQMSPGDGYYSVLPLFHQAGRAALFAAAMFEGRCVYRASFKTDRFWSDIAETRCTATMMMPVMAKFLLAAPPSDLDASTPLKYVAMVPLLPEIDAFRNRFGVTARTGFNMTELAMPILTEGLDQTVAGSCGKVRDGFECRLVDSDDQEVAIGETGELIVRAREPWTLMAGYWNQPEKTVEAWRNLWFHTGDSFFRDDDGNYFYVDRLKDALRRRGENISSIEVETEINAHPAVAESAVIGVPAEDGEQEVMAFIRVEPGHTVTEADVYQFLQPRLARYMLPRYIRFIDSFPKTEATLRIQKAKLREIGVDGQTWESA